jgi:putative salt-induced outer membrane protein YdiY
MRVTNNFGATTFVVAAGLIFFQSAAADVLILNNGDRITGTIKQIWDGEVTIEPDYADEFEVDLEVVDHIESERDFELEFEDGTEVVAKFPGVDDESQQLITVDNQPEPISLADILELDEPAKDFDWESHVDFSATINSGNTNSSNSQFRGDSQIEIPDHRHLVEFKKLHEEIDDTTTKNQSFLKYNYNWLFNDPWFFAANASYETDPIIELDARIIVSAGLGRDIFNTPRRLLSIQLGAGAQSEKYASETDENSVAVWSLRYRQDVFNGDLEIFHDHTITENLAGRDNTSYKTSTGLRYEITDLLYANLTLNYDYETEPVDAAKNEDMALLVGVGAEF